MNTRTLFFALWTLPFWADAQNVIPNASFENWSNTAPSGWTTNNSGVVTTVTQVADPRDGQFALRGTVVPGTNTISQAPMLQSIYGNLGFPVDEDFTQITLWFKSFLWGGDHFNVNIAIYDAGFNLVGGGSGFASGIVPDYTLLTVPIIHFAPGAAFANISLTISDPTGQTNGHIQSWFQADNLTGPDLSTSIIPATQKYTESWAVCKDGNIQLIASKPGNYRVEAISITGQKIFSVESSLLRGELLSMPLRSTTNYRGIILIRTERNGELVNTLRQVL
ncbi:MAG: hypothetical protein ACKOQ6_03260 [Bacteroidota bacterium]